MAELAATRRLQGYLGTPTDDAVSFADQFLVAAEDHFGALCRLVEHEAPVLYADKVLARAGIEASARAAWMLDPSLDARARAGRGLTQRFAVLKANAELRKDTVERRASLGSRRDELITRCHAAGLDVKRFDGTAAVGDRIPSERTFMRNLFGFDTGDQIDLGSFTQAWLSRFVHSDPAGLMENFMDELPPDVVVPAVPGMVTKGLASNSDRVSMLLAMCTTGYLMASGMFLYHQGWVDDGWTETTIKLRTIVRSSLGLPKA